MYNGSPDCIFAHNNSIMHKSHYHAFQSTYFTQIRTISDHTTSTYPFVRFVYTLDAARFILHPSPLLITQRERFFRRIVFVSLFFFSFLSPFPYNNTTRLFPFAGRANIFLSRVLVCMTPRIRVRCPTRWTTFRRMCLDRMALWRDSRCRCPTAAKTPAKSVWLGNV